MKDTVLVLFSLLIAHSTIGQMPATDLYLFDISLVDDTLSLNNPTFISAFNKNGYNNQPAFIGDDLYITTNVFDLKKTEFLKLDFENQQYTRVTNTPESEFSPTLTPSGQEISAIRIERDGTDQSLWKYPRDQSGPGKRLLPKLTTVGYHSWLSDHVVALFLVDDPIKLVIADTNTQNTRYLLDNIGRCLRTDSGGALIIVHKLFDDKWYLKKFDPGRRTFKLITQTPGLVEDFLLLADDSILMASGSKLLRYANQKITDNWEEVDDLSDIDINNISRMATDGKRLVLVNAKN